jgi:hypothetical protein
MNLFKNPVQVQKSNVLQNLQSSLPQSNELKTSGRIKINAIDFKSSLKRFTMIAIKKAEEQMIKEELEKLKRKKEIEEKKN